MEKRCSKCGEYKDLSEFTKNKTRPDGLDGWCRDCKRRAQRAWRGYEEKVPAEYLKDVWSARVSEMFKNGHRVKDIAHELDLSKGLVQTILVELYGTSKSLSERQKTVKALFEQGLLAPEIAERVGTSAKSVIPCLKSMGLFYTDEQKALSKKNGKKKAEATRRRLYSGEAKYKERAEAYGYDYLGGYTNSDGKIRLKCRVCGFEFEYSCIALRQRGEAPRCSGCCRIQAERKREEKRAVRELERQKAREEREAEAREREARRHKVCAECGKPFVSSTGKFCSEQCRRKSMNRRKDAKRRGYKQKISLTKLYERDHGICYLCGRRCDFDDYTDDGAFIVGMSYPTVEHVIPISKGGDDGWDNVKLACFACNTKKSTHSALKIEQTGQLSLVI